MKAVRVHEFGGPDVLRLDEVAQPTPGPGEVLVQVRGAGINPYEGYQREGRYPNLPPLPFILGGEGAGDVVAVGEGVTMWKAGDAVWGNLKGSHAEYALAAADLLYPKPDRLDYHAAAGLTTAWVTSVLGLVTLAGMQRGDTVLVHGAAGGVGSAAVQLAHAWGAHVIGTAGSEAKAEVAHQLGADVVVDYSRQDVETAVRQAAPGGVDIVFDGVGAPVFMPSVRTMAAGGRYVLYGGHGGRTITFEAPEFYRRNLTMIGFSANSSPRIREARATLRDKLVPLFADGTLRGVVARVFPLAEAAAAYRFLDSRAAQGKVVLDPTRG